MSDKTFLRYQRPDLRHGGERQSSRDRHWAAGDRRRDQRAGAERVREHCQPEPEAILAGSGNGLSRVPQALPGRSRIGIATHEAALGIVRRGGFGFYDALIVASALEAGCPVLLT